ncbi:MAG: hypothetical protein EXR86_03370 [Gammaproteobacteria bacterium]|nr:hypothetical protein [Gammaproteobacteria bacterium]
MLRLARVEPWGAVGHHRQPFLLLFSGPVAPLLPQRIYHLEHQSLGGIDLFLVPIGPHESGIGYEAVFN